jgi:Fe-S cluster assembly ATP-binding protein
MLEIDDVWVQVEDKPILQGISLTVKPGEIHAIMGPNGAGKSTLARVLAGHPAYEVNRGKIIFEGMDILELDATERAHAGLFASFQYPVELPGVNNVLFLRAALNAKLKARGLQEIGLSEFEAFLDAQMEALEIKPEFKQRNVNEGFSGGEKKRNEILQMAILDPKLAILDETDSGLDIDALRVVAQGIKHLMRPDRGLVLITHYQRLLDFIEPTFVHVMIQGKIVQSGSASLAKELEEKGYEWLMPASEEVG